MTQKWTVHLDEGASLLDSIKTPGHKSALARDEENTLSQATLRPVRLRDEAAKDVALLVTGALGTLAAVAVGYVIRKRKAAQRESATEVEAAAEGAQSAETAAAEAEAEVEVDEQDALIESTYSAIEASKPRRATPVAAHPEEDPDLDAERVRERRPQVRRR